MTDDQLFDAAHEACECRTAAGGFIFTTRDQLRAFLALADQSTTPSESFEEWASEEGINNFHFNHCHAAWQAALASNKAAAVGVGEPVYPSDPYIDTMAVNACVAGDGKGRLIFTIQAARKFALDVLRARDDGAFEAAAVAEPGEEYQVKSEPIMCWETYQDRAVAQKHFDQLKADGCNAQFRVIYTAPIASAEELITQAAALAFIDQFEIVGDNNDSRDPTDEEKFILREFILQMFDDTTPPSPIASAEQAVPVAALAVWYGSMPESNGKTNWTAILHNGDMASGMTIDQSEYPDRVRYEADRVRWLIGDLDKEPWIEDYDTDKHSGYVAHPAAAQPARAEVLEILSELAVLKRYHQSTNPNCKTVRSSMVNIPHELLDRIDDALKAKP